MMDLLHSAEFWVLVAFIILVAGIFNKVRTALNNALDTRAARIKAQLEEAQKLRTDAQALLAEYQRKQNTAAEDAQRIVDHAKEEAVRMREQAKADLEQALKRREQQAVDKIAQAEAEALKEVRHQAVELAVAATARLLTDNMDEKRTGQLVDEAIKDLPAKLH